VIVHYQISRGNKKYEFRHHAVQPPSTGSSLFYVSEIVQLTEVKGVCLGLLPALHTWNNGMMEDWNVDLKRKFFIFVYYQLGCQEEYGQ